MRDLTLVLFICKFGFAVSDNVTSLALLDRGFRKEHLALFALIDFPLQILYAVIAGKLSSGAGPLNPVRAALIAPSIDITHLMLVLTYSLGPRRSVASIVSSAPRRGSGLDAHGILLSYR